MTKTYAQLMKQIDALTRDADRLKRAEVGGVVARIQEALATYGLTAADVGLGAKRGPKPGYKRAGKKKAVKAVKAVARLRDQDANSWVGRGPMLQWPRGALASGKSPGFSKWEKWEVQRGHPLRKRSCISPSQAPCITAL